jgi:8-oxo-dGTP diphosphatase
MNERPKVGVGLLLVKDGKILLGKRKGAHGAGEYAGFGGHLEGLETFEDGLLRELAEEGGSDIKVKNLCFLSVTNLRKYAPKHYVDIGMVAEWESGEPQIMEPDKIESWGWHDIDNLPEPLFGVIDNYVEAYKTGKVYFND